MNKQTWTTIIHRNTEMETETQSSATFFMKKMNQETSAFDGAMSSMSLRPQSLYVMEKKS